MRNSVLGTFKNALFSISAPVTAGYDFCPSLAFPAASQRLGVLCLGLHIRRSLSAGDQRRSTEVTNYGGSETLCYTELDFLLATEMIESGILEGGTNPLSYNICYWCKVRIDRMHSHVNGGPMLLDKWENLDICIFHFLQKIQCVLYYSRSRNIPFSSWFFILHLKCPSTAASDKKWSYFSNLSKNSMHYAK